MMHFLKLRALLTLSIFVVFASCGQNHHTNGRSALSVSEANYLMIEKQCQSNNITLEPVTSEIAKTYREFQGRFNQAFFMIPPRFYDYKNPLVVNLKDMEAALLGFREKMNDTDYMEKNQSSMATDLFHMFQSIMRFEGQKCGLPSLALKKRQDIRPYMAIKNLCIEKNNEEFCSPQTIKSLTPKEAASVEQNALFLCQFFNDKDADCVAQFVIQKKNRKADTLPGFYQKKFQKEYYEKLFVLRDSHLKFQCQKNENSIYMNLKVSSIGWNTEVLQTYLNHISKTWSRDNFQLKLEMTEEKGNGVIEIILMDKGISYVPDNDNRKVFLSRALPVNQTLTVLAHEFGHVLGFPDCYTEFFDSQKKSLIYYEISAEDTNIMCSMKNGVAVPPDYFNQLAQKSCLFN